ncbi:MAG: hypothetical protein ABJ092_10795 [Gillisia sp.]
MIFNSARISSARKKIARLVEEQTPKSFPGSPKSLGIIIDAKNKEALNILSELKKQLKIPAAGFKVIYVSPNKVKPEDLEATVFNLQDFDAKGEIINKELEEITSQGVDLLLTFAAENNTTAHLLTAYFKAGLKVGRYQQNAALYDLILQTEEDPELFVEELLKYLKHVTKKSNE